MFEYIKRVSIAISFISQKIGEPGDKVKNNLEDLSLDLLLLAQSFKDDRYQASDLQKLESKISYLIDLVDYARISGLVTSMNSKVFVDSQLAFLKHILNLLDQKASLSIPLYRLKELDEVMARKNAKESILGKSDTQFSNLQNKTNNLSYENIQVNNSTVKTEFEEEIKVAETPEFKFEPKKIVEEKLLHPEVSVEKVEKEIKDRRDKILRILTTGGGSIREIASKMGDVNEKTLQRDLLELMRDKKVIMLGKKRWAKYYLK
jgi:hypothetical protein